MPQTPTTTFDVAQNIFNTITFATQTPLATPALDLTKPPIAAVWRPGVPDHDAYRELVNLIARPDKYRIPTRWDKQATITTNLWHERFEDGCDVTFETKDILRKGDVLRIVLDGQVGCAEILYRSMKPLFAIGQFTVGTPYNIASIAFCAGIDMLRAVGRNAEGDRGKMWTRLAHHIAGRIVIEGIEDKLHPIISDAGILTQSTESTSGGKSFSYHGGRQDDSYDPGARLGNTYPFTAEYKPRQNASDLFERILKDRSITIKHDVEINPKGKQAQHILAMQEFMAAAAALQPSLFSTKPE